MFKNGQILESQLQEYVQLKQIPVAICQIKNRQ